MRRHSTGYNQPRGQLRLSQLRKIISEEARKIISEEKEAEEESGEDSIDSQIDSYFSDYESKSKSVKKNESKSLLSFMKKLLREAEEDEEKKDDEEDEEKGEEDKDEEPKKLTSVDINLESFANDVVRLIENYDSLLEVRNTILRRAVNFLLKSYEPDVSDTFKEVLEDNHGLEIGKSKTDLEDDFEIPRADRAGNSPGGA